MYEIRLWQSPSGQEPVTKWLDRLDAISFKKLSRLILMLKREGPNLGMPHCRHLGDGLMELRALGVGSGYRIYYCIVEDKVVVLLAGGDKDSQKRDIEIARNRMENIEV